MCYKTTTIVQFFSQIVPGFFSLNFPGFLVATRIHLLVVKVCFVLVFLISVYFFTMMMGAARAIFHGHGRWKIHGRGEQGQGDFVLRNYGQYSVGWWVNWF